MSKFSQRKTFSVCNIHIASPAIAAETELIDNNNANDRNLDPVYLWCTVRSYAPEGEKWDRF